MKSAVELGRMIRAKEVTSEEVVSAYISRTQEVNPYLNVIVGNRFDAALKEAREVDKILASDNIPEKYSEKQAPFLGVPMTTKEAISIEGLPNTSGLISRKGVTSSKDAAVIVAMRRAGAIPLAVTNVSELCMWYESSNLVYGRSNNAYHQGRIVGGSSGGEGCLQSSGGSAFGLGSDIGGSIRMPCVFNGIFGHKATTGVINNSGQFPYPKAGGVNFLSTGPMCRFACDLMPIFKILALPDFQDQLKLEEKVDVTKLKYYYMEDDGGSMLISPVHPEIKEAVIKAADHFEKLGCQVKKVSLTKMKYSFQFWASMMSNSGDDTFCTLLGDKKPINPYIELLYWLVQFPRHTLPAIGLGIGEKIRSPPEHDAKLKSLCEGLLKEFQDLLGEDGIFLYPTHPIPAPFHNKPLFVLFNFAYTGIFNMLGLPATAVPMGICSEEVPIGIQVVGAKYSDRLTLAVALELEKAFKGWVPPFDVSI